MNKAGLIVGGLMIAAFIVGLQFSRSLLSVPPEAAPTIGLPHQDAQRFVRQLSKSFVVIGHRGAQEERPENTLASIRQAFAIGLGIVEIDIHLTRDSVPIVIHDDTVDRTTNGEGVVKEMTLAQLKALDAGSW